MSAFYKVKSYAVTKGSKNKELSEKFIRFINSEKYALDRYLITSEVVPMIDVIRKLAIMNDDFSLTVLKQSQISELMPDKRVMNDILGPVNTALVKSFENIDDIEVNLDDCVENILKNRDQVIEKSADNIK